MTSLEWYDDVRGGADFDGWYVRIYAVDGKYVVADQGGWLPGEFDTSDDALEAARQANAR